MSLYTRVGLLMRLIRRIGDRCFMTMITMGNTKQHLNKIRPVLGNPPNRLFYPMADPIPYQYIVKFVIIGDSGVGKSNLMLRLTDDRYMVRQYLALSDNKTRTMSQLESNLAHR